MLMHLSGVHIPDSDIKVVVGCMVALLFIHFYEKKQKKKYKHENEHTLSISIKNIDKNLLFDRWDVAIELSAFMECLMRNESKCHVLKKSQSLTNASHSIYREQFHKTNMKITSALCTPVMPRSSILQ